MPADRTGLALNVPFVFVRIRLRTVMLIFRDQNRLLRWVFAGVALSFGFAPTSLLAEGQEDAGVAGKDKPSIANRVVIIPRDGDLDSSKKRPEKPSRPGNPEASADVKNLVKEFKEAREIYLEQQKETARQIKEDSKEAREVIRDQNKELLDQLKEQQKALRQEAHDRARDIKRDLNADIGRVIDAGDGEGRGRGR